MQPDTPPAGAGSAGGKHRSGAAASFAALGIVFGDLGTSPLYTVQTIIGASGGHPGAADVLGILSLVIWALVVVVSVKYCLVVMRADNRGEGGILALLSLVGSSRGARLGPLVVMGLFGASLIYGDGMITPAISVLSALEGVNVATSALKPYIMPLAVVILVALFAVQRFGTARIGRAFGPVMLLWFIVIGVLGARGVMQHPGVLLALDPTRGLGFLIHHGWGSLAVLGGVFLAVTGGEALYADLGHFGRNPIRAAWFFVALPGLLLSYAGQAAVLLDDPGMADNPFFKTVPGWGLYPMVVLATAATIIASQAIITGAFSLTRQAIQLGWMPGLYVRQTSTQEYGQIYVPFVNWLLMALTVALTIGFGSSEKLAGAYGTAVSTTMWLTTALLYRAMRDRWHWPVLAAAVVTGLFLVVDLTFFAANLLKIAEGGWIPLLLGAIIFFIMTTWWAGIAALRQKAGTVVDETPENFVARLAAKGIPRVPGTAVFLTRLGPPLSPLIVRQVEQFGSLHKTVVSLCVQFEEQPWLTEAERIKVEHIADGFWYVVVHFGFAEPPDLMGALELARQHGCDLTLDDAGWFAAHDEVVRAKRHPRLPPWQREPFAFMYRNAVHASDRFTIPADKFLELGRQIAL